MWPAPYRHRPERGRIDLEQCLPGTDHRALLEQAALHDAADLRANFSGPPCHDATGQLVHDHPRCGRNRHGQHFHLGGPGAGAEALHPASSEMDSRGKQARRKGWQSWQGLSTRHIAFASRLCGDCVEATGRLPGAGAIAPS
jgi:hypothetical protein